MKLLAIILSLMLDLVPQGPAYTKHLQQRDTLLVGDQLEYGFELDSLPVGVSLTLNDFKSFSTDYATVVRDWKIDTLRLYVARDKEDSTKAYRPYVNIRGSVVLAFFDELKISLNPIKIVRSDQEDTLVFSAPPAFVVKDVPIDTATFVIHDIKGQVVYPLTFAEIFPWVAGGLLLAGLAVLAIFLIRSHRRKVEERLSKDPPHIIALRNLEKYRGDKFWQPEKQKAFYSGVTDTLKSYIVARFGVDAQEMTTAELFDALKGSKDITPDLYGETRNLFDTADFVKFAKYTAPDDYNAKVLPTAVRFVSDTYRSGLEEEPESDVL